MAALESKVAIIERLPASVAALTENAAVAFSDAASGRNVFELPAALRSEGIRSIEVGGLAESLPPAVSRVVDLLIRDAGLLVDSVQGLEATARQRSEAEANRRIAASERRFRALVERSTDLVIVISPDGLVS